MVDVVFDGGPWDGHAASVLTNAEGRPLEWLQVPSPSPDARPHLYVAASEAPAPGDPWRYEHVGPS